MDFPRWAIWLMNIAVVTAIYLVSQVFKLVGWQVTLGFVAGFICCYVMYRCWRVDDVDEGYRRFPPEERERRILQDLATDSRVRDKLLGCD